MERRRKLELLLDDIRSLLADRTRGPRDYALPHAVWNLASFLDQLSQDAAKTRAVLEVACLLRASDGPGRQGADERLMANLRSLAWRCRGRLDDAKVARLPGFSGIIQAPPEMQPTFQVLHELRDFALTCFAFKRPRDSFGGRRRALAFDILAEVGLSVDLPEAVGLARQALRKAQSVEARQAAEFLQRYFAARDLSPDEATTEDLLALAERTDSRSTAVGALNALVETGTMSEFEALDRLDDWKSKH
jgi:hypothetical protein